MITYLYVLYIHDIPGIYVLIIITVTADKLTESSIKFSSYLYIRDSVFIFMNGQVCLGYYRDSNDGMQRRKEKLKTLYWMKNRNCFKETGRSNLFAYIYIYASLSLSQESADSLKAKEHLYILPLIP